MRDQLEHRGVHPLLQEISSRLAGALPDQIDTIVEESMQRIGGHFDVDRVMIAPVSMTGEIDPPLRLWLSNAWTAKGLGNGLPPMPQSVGHIAEERALVFGRLDVLKEWPEDREALKRLGIGASAVTVLEAVGSHLVTMRLDSMRPAVDWPEDVAPDLWLMGRVILKALHRQEAEHDSRRLRGFARLVSEISSGLVNLPPEQVDEEIEKALGRVGEHLDVDLTTMTQWTDSSRTNWMVSHEWDSEVVGGVHFRGTVIGAEFPWLSARLQETDPLVVSSLDDLPPEAVPERATCERIDIQSMLAVPYKAEGTVGGHVFLNTIHRQRSWSDSFVPQLRLVGQVLASAVARQQADIALNRAHVEIRSLKDRLEAENLSLREEVRQAFEHEELIGRSYALQRVLRRVDQVAATGSLVLLLGETGTGKGLIARIIHAGSRRADRPLITVNCAALPGLLIESELFGHEKGAFTGAEAKKIGRFEMAEGGTLFLDEIGDLPLELQAKLLRILHDREFERVGSSKTMTTDARIIVATNRNLDKLVEQGTFRADLFHRLNVFPIQMPALRDYREDIPLLAWYFVGKLRGKLGRQIEAISPAAMERLKTYHWPGNVRELHNVLERAIILSPGSTLEIDDIHLGVDTVEHPAMAEREPHEKSLQDVEREHILQVLEDCGWKVRGKDGAAERLGVKRTTLNSRMKKLGIERPTA